MVIVDGKLTWGFERGDITFACPGRIAIQVALTAADTKKEGFRTERVLNRCHSFHPESIQATT
jgi:hypothetical protein